LRDFFQPAVVAGFLLFGRGGSGPANAGAGRSNKVLKFI
jgi:hypothetical protein